jgi:hypothetical protein
MQENVPHTSMRMHWTKALRIVNPILLFIAVWMIVDGHRTAALVLLLLSLAVQLTAISYEQ